jgi:hypothetical protein
MIGSGLGFGIGKGETWLEVVAFQMMGSDDATETSAIALRSFSQLRRRADETPAIRRLVLAGGR